MRKLFSKIKHYLIVEEWNVAIREKEEALLFEQGGTTQPFCVLKNSFRYWAADPFIISDKDKDYLFFEMFDRFKRKGVIGCREIVDGKIGRMKPVYEMDKHLSFPFVFQINGEYYMMPEASESKLLPLLKARFFPDRWELFNSLMEQRRLVDSALLFIADKEYLFTQEIKKGYKSKTLDLYVKAGDNWIPHENNPIVSSSAFARLAGRIFTHQNCIFRVAQDCSESYGKKLHFFRIDELSNTQYGETEVTEVSVDNVCIKGKKRFNGIHTYNFSERYEVIDLKNTDHISLGNIIYTVYYTFIRFFKDNSK